MSETVDNERFRKLLLSSPATAIEILYHQYSQSLQKIAVYFTKDIHVAEDVVEEAFILVWENRKMLSRNHERSILHFLVKVVKYKAISQFKKARSVTDQKTKYLNHRK